MEKKAVFIRFISRNEKSGESAFYVRMDNKPVICKGEVANYLKGSPLSITGEYEKREFRIEKVCFSYTSKEDVKAFLSEGHFNGVGEAVANAIINTLGEDLFKRLKVEDTEALSGLVKVNKEAVYRALCVIKSYLDFEDIYGYLKSIGCDYYTSQLLFEKFGAAAPERIKNNPYVLLYAGVDFASCERIAKETGVRMCDRKRTYALLENAMTLNRNSGNTRIEMEKLFELEKKEEDKAGCFTTPRLFLAEALTDKKYKLEEIGEKLYVYLKDDYENESSIALSIKRLSNTAVMLGNTISVDDVEKDLGITYGKDQKEAFKTIEKSGVAIITGGPGTGKTTLLEGLLYKYEKENPGKEVVLCAPTSCAARRMQEHTKKNAQTIHRLLGIRPFEKDEVRMRSQALSADLIVVDECSMVDCDIMARLLSSVKNSALVLILGDADQLPSVSAGNVFADLIESGEITTFRLGHIFRQGPKSLIIDNSMKVKSGDYDIKTGKNFVIQRCDTEEELVNRAVDIYRKCESRGITDLKLYTPSRNKKFKSGATVMNLLLKKKPKESEELTFGYYSFCVGDKVIFNNNNYDKGYFNGEEGVITSIQKLYNEIYVKVETDDGALFLGKNELSDLDLAYAITAHKSQGAECRNAVILVPKKPASMLKRQLLYVEITRAKENVMILSEKDALEDAISSRYEFVRNTGLIEKLRSA